MTNQVVIHVMQSYAGLSNFVEPCNSEDLKKS